MLIDLVRFQIACDWIEQSGIVAPEKDALCYVSAVLKQESEIESIIQSRLPHIKRKSYQDDFPWLQEIYARTICEFIGAKFENIFYIPNAHYTRSVELVHHNPWLEG